MTLALALAITLAAFALAAVFLIGAWTSGAWFLFAGAAAVMLVVFGLPLLIVIACAIELVRSPKITDEKQETRK